MNPKYLLKLTLAYIKRFKGIIFTGVIIGVTMFFAINFILPKILAGETQRIGITGRYRPDNLSPEILNLVGEGLTKLENSSPTPGLAESWESPDKGKTWIFKLKDDIYWQDGTKVESADINYEFSDVTVERPDERTIKFILEKGPYSPFPTVVSKPIFKKGLLGTGSWSVKKISVNNTYVEELVLEKNKDKLYYKFYPTLDQTKLAYKLGKIDEILNTTDSKPFDSWGNSEITNAENLSQVVTLFFNTQDKILSDKSARQALVYAIDKVKLGTRAYSPINSDSWAYNPQLKSYDYDPERAKELLDELPNEMRDNLEINLVSTPTLLPVAEEISRNWAAIDIKTQILVSSVIPSEFQTFLTIFDIPDDPDQYPIWHSTQTDTNISNYASARIDKLLEDGRIQMDTEERRKIYLDFQRYLLEDLPAAFLYHPNYFTITRK